MKNQSTIQAAIMMFLLLIVSVPSHSQSSHVALLLNTANSNLNYGDMNSSLQAFKKDVRGLRAGLSWQAGVTQRFSIVTEAYFAKKGGTLKSGNPLTGVESSLHLYTVEVPVLARVHAGRFYFNAGPYVSYIFSGKRTSETEASQAISFGQGPDAFRKWEAGVQGGVGYEFSIKKKRLALDLRYNHGLTSFSRNQDLYNRTLNISISVLRTWKKKS